MANGQDADAEAQPMESLKLAEEARAQIGDAQGRGSFCQPAGRLSRDGQLSFLNKSDPAAAFKYAEIAKGRDLLDALTGATGDRE